jgi:hypothetical protein
MSYKKYQSQEWVNIQQEMDEDDNSASIMDEFDQEKNIIVTEQQDKFLKSLSKAVENGELEMIVAFRIIREIHK